MKSVVVIMYPATSRGLFVVLVARFMYARYLRSLYGVLEACVVWGSYDGSRDAYRWGMMLSLLLRVLLLLYYNTQGTWVTLYISSVLIIATPRDNVVHAPEHKQENCPWMMTLVFVFF